MRKSLIFFLSIFLFKLNALSQEQKNIKCTENKYKEDLYLILDFENKKLGYSINSVPINLDYVFIKNNNNIIIAKSQEISAEQKYNDGAIVQTHDYIAIDRINGLAKKYYEISEDTRKDTTPNSYFIYDSSKYWEAKDCELIKNEAKF